MEGQFKLKHNSGGWRHYIELPDGRHYDINCGEMLEVQLGKYVEKNDYDEHFEPGQWLKGRYEANLTNENPKATLIIGRVYPTQEPLNCRLYEGSIVRV